MSKYNRYAAIAKGALPGMHTTVIRAIQDGGIGAIAAATAILAGTAPSGRQPVCGAPHSAGSASAAIGLPLDGGSSSAAYCPGKKTDRFCRMCHIVRSLPRSLPPRETPLSPFALDPAGLSFVCWGLCGRSPRSVQDSRNAKKPAAGRKPRSGL